MTTFVPAAFDRTLPYGRGRWKVQIGQRGFTNYAPEAHVEAELTSARSRRLERELNKPAKFSFATDGHSPAAMMIKELENDILVYRWSEVTGRDEEMFRGIVTQSQDTISEQRHTVTFSAQDLLGVAYRRPFANPLSYVQADQDYIAAELMLAYLHYFRSSDQDAPNNYGTNFDPAATIPHTTVQCFGDGSTGRPLSGRLRDRNYPAQTILGQAIENLSNVIDGFDFDVVPISGENFLEPDLFRIFYPYKGVQRTEWSFTYGSTVSSLSRSVNSANYGNYARVIGQAPQEQPEVEERQEEPEPIRPQLFAEAWIVSGPGAANDVISNPKGFWALTDSLSDVTEQSTLNERALRMVADGSILVPSYSLSIRAGQYRDGLFDIGDTVRLVIRSGRLDVDTWVRVLGVNFAIGDDGTEDVEVTVGRPSPNFLRNLRATNERVGALERR